MHHKNHANSTANHNNPQHHKPSSTPPPQPPKKASVLNRIRERFKEKPATADEVKQLRLNAQRETYKTQIQKAKTSRPSRFSGFGGGGQSRSPSYRRTSHYADNDSFLFGGGNRGSGFLDMGNGPSLDFITGNSSKSSRGKRQTSGLEEMF